MQFLNESSLEDLYASAVSAFPRTKKRQHATDPIIIAGLRWTPFRGLNTLFVKGLAQSEGKEYNPIIVFKKVDYTKNEVRLTASDGLEYKFGKLSLESTDVLVRCNCPDFRWRFSYYNHVDKSLYGRKPAEYNALGVRPPANPMQMEGMCKHIMKLVKVLKETEMFLG